MYFKKMQEENDRKINRMMVAMMRTQERGTQEYAMNYQPPPKRTRLDKGKDRMEEEEEEEEYERQQAIEEAKRQLEKLRPTKQMTTRARNLKKNKMIRTLSEVGRLSEVDQLAALEELAEKEGCPVTGNTVEEATEEILKNWSQGSHSGN